MKTILDNLLQIETAQIDFDTNNPRRESPSQIINQQSFKNLVESVKEDGIIVPIIVKKDNGGYVLIDGERRLRAAIETRLDKVPALLAKNHVEGKILAYKIHKLHQKWSTVAETMSIKDIVNQLKKDNPDVSDAILKKKIIEITHENNTKASDMLEIIKFDDEIIEKAMTNELSHSYLVHIGKSFIQKLKNKYPSILIKYPDEKLRSILAEKALKGLLGKKTRFLMDDFKIVFEDDDNRTEIEKIILKFIEIKQRDILVTFEEYNKLVENKSTKNIGKADGKGKVPNDSSITSKPTRAQSIKDHKKIGVDRKEQTKLFDIRKKYEAIAKGFSVNEEQYLKEAIHCLDEHCFKAATLMVWSAGISRILAYIEQNISDFNTKSREMKGQNTSYYKHFSTNFRSDFTIIDEIRHSSRDMQLLCYLCYKGFITEPSFNKLKGHYNKRNDCAHPTEIVLYANETIAIFEDVLDLILLNNKMK